MKIYIVVADVDSLLGEGWTTADKKDRAVMIANVWLNGKNLPDIDPIPQEWVQAGAEVAREAAAGKIYGSVEYGLTSKAVKADTVSVSKTFASGHKIVSAGESLALALLKPWLGDTGVIKMVRG